MPTLVMPANPHLDNTIIHDVNTNSTGMLEVAINTLTTSGNPGGFNTVFIRTLEVDSISELPTHVIEYSKDSIFLVLSQTFGWGCFSMTAGCQPAC
eukprot:2049417-Amphidinium_carterae.1